MENRLVFVTAEQARSLEGVQESQTEELGSDLKNAAEQLKTMGNIQATPGGSAAADDLGRMKEEMPKKGRENVEQLLVERKAALTAREADINPQTTARLDAVNGKIKAEYQKAKERVKDRAVLNAEFERLASLGDADEIFANVKIVAKGETQDFKWKPGGISANLEGFKNLGIPKGKRFLAEMKDALVANPDGAEAILEKYANDPRLSKNRRDYAKDPEKYGHTKQHAAEWFQEKAEVDKTILHRMDSFRFLESKQPLMEEAGVKMPNEQELFDKDTDEFNQYFESLTSKINKVDSAQAEKFANQTIEDKSDIKELKEDNATKVETQDASEAEKFKALKKTIEDSPLRERMQKKIAAAKTESDKDAGNTSREEALAESGGLKQFGKLGKSILSVFKKDEAGEASDEKNVDPEQEQKDKEEHDRLTTGVIDEMTGAKEGQEGETTLNPQDRQDLKEVFGIGSNDLDKTETQAALQLVALDVKNLTAKTLEDESKKTENRWMKNKMEKAKTAA